MECTPMSIEKRLGELEKVTAAQTGTMEAESVRAYRRTLLQHPDVLELLRMSNEGDTAAKQRFDARVQELGLAPPSGTIDPDALKKARIARLYYDRAMEAGDLGAAAQFAGRIRALGFEV